VRRRRSIGSGRLAGSALSETALESAVIVRARLPAALETLRRRGNDNAPRGIPAHVTLLYPFVDPVDLSRAVRSTVAEIAAGQPSFDYRLTGPRLWPDAVYAAVEPDRQFLRLHHDLVRAFPGYSTYGRPGFDLVPHVTVAEGASVGDPAVLAAPAWRALPVRGQATALEVIASDAAGRWRLIWRTPLATR
jgi:2'-5' RNA ligase